MFPDLRNNLKSNGSSLYKCSIGYRTLKRSFAPRILTTTSGGGGREARAEGRRAEMPRHAPQGSRETSLGALNNAIAWMSEVPLLLIFQLPFKLPLTVCSTIGIVDGSRPCRRRKYAKTKAKTRAFCQISVLTLALFTLTPKALKCPQNASALADPKLHHSLHPRRYCPSVSRLSPEMPYANLDLADHGMEQESGHCCPSLCGPWRMLR